MLLSYIISDFPLVRPPACPRGQSGGRATVHYGAGPGRHAVKLYQLVPLGLSMVIGVLAGLWALPENPEAGCSSAALWRSALTSPFNAHRLHTVTLL